MNEEQLLQAPIRSIPHAKHIILMWLGLLNDATDVVKSLEEPSFSFDNAHYDKAWNTYWGFMRTECKQVWEEEDVSVEYAEKCEMILFSSIWLCVKPDEYLGPAGNALQTWDENRNSTTFDQMEILLRVDPYILARRRNKTLSEVSRERDAFAQRYHIIRDARPLQSESGHSE
jgi:hypothetical protein